LAVVSYRLLSLFGKPDPSPKPTTNMADSQNGEAAELLPPPPPGAASDEKPMEVDSKIAIEGER
jgi:hypothetical protein